MVTKIGRLFLNLFLVLFVISNVNGAPFTTEIDDSSSVKIIGGVPATPGEFPFVVSLQTKARNGLPTKHSCGATLITPSKLITAANCVRNGYAYQYAVVAGAYTMEDVLSGQQEAQDIEKITIHPNYVSGSSHDDLAVIDLVNPFSNSSTIQTISLARRSAQYIGTCVIAGWGAINASSTTVFSDKLMKGDVQVHPKEYCKLAYEGYNEDKEICANGRNGAQTVDVCNGDLGGPLICTDPENGQRYLAGVASYINMCGNAEKPGVYMEVSKYRGWLDYEIYSDGGQGTTTTKATTTRATTLAPTTVASTKKPMSDDIIDKDNGLAAATESKPENHKPVFNKCSSGKLKI